MKRWIITLPAQDASVEPHGVMPVELDSVMSVVVAGSVESNGRILVDILSHDDLFDPSNITDAVILYNGEGEVSADILNFIAGPGIPHTWATLENPSIQQPDGKYGLLE